jgi:hypothetical protein
MNTNSLHSDYIIIGAGAAGLFAAGKLTQLGKTVRIIDSEDKPGKKILISGGGYCNFTKIHLFLIIHTFVLLHYPDIPPIIL